MFYSTPAPQPALNEPVASETTHPIPGAIYHLVNRGDRRQSMFEDDKDREMFLETLTDACEKTAWQVHAYSLMDAFRWIPQKLKRLV